MSDGIVGNQVSFEGSVMEIQTMLLLLHEAHHLSEIMQILLKRGKRRRTLGPLVEGAEGGVCSNISIIEAARNEAVWIGESMLLAGNFFKFSRRFSTEVLAWPTEILHTERAMEH